MRPGDRVEADEPLCDVSTDKVDVEIPAPVSGALARIAVEPGETVEVGAVLAELDVGEGEPADAEVDGPTDRSRVYSPIVRRRALAEELGARWVEPGDASSPSATSSPPAPSAA